MRMLTIVRNGADAIHRRTREDGRMSPIAYHRLARLRPRYRWWRMLLTGLLALAFYVVILLLVMVPIGVVSVLIPGRGSSSRSCCP